MRPFYFGDSLRPLYGVYEVAAGSSARRAVLLCYPFGAEYLRSHRAFRELGHRLSQAGIHALRFDFFGCGDSSGSHDEGTIDLWIEDIRLAIEELREASGVERPSVLGLRFGGTLAALAASQGVSVDQLLLWDPIVNGKAYLEELSSRHAALVGTRSRPAGYVPDDPPSEALGMPLPPTLLDGLRSIDLASLPACSARTVVLIGDANVPATAALRGRLESLGVPVEQPPVASAPVWLKQDEMDRALVPREMLDLFVQRLGEGRE